jgi:hypothetical protein
VIENESQRIINCDARSIGSFKTQREKKKKRVYLSALLPCCPSSTLVILKQSYIMLFSPEEAVYLKNYLCALVASEE